jgi:hypothetical protein
MKSGFFAKRMVGMVGYPIITRIRAYARTRIRYGG